MTVDQQKLRQLLGNPKPISCSRQLRREGKTFFVSGELPVKETLETIFDSYCQDPADIFCLTIDSIDTFHKGEELARQLKKNFNSHLLGCLDFAAPRYMIERAYAAGVDILDIPLHVYDQALAAERGLARGERLQSLHDAQGIFPRWGVISSLVAGEEASCSTISGIDSLADAGVVPLVELSPRASRYPHDEIAAIYSHLAQVWRKRKMVINPLLPVLHATTPLVSARPRGLIQGWLDRMQDRRLLATSDLRRSLKVRQVDASFDSAGL